MITLVFEQCLALTAIPFLVAAVLPLVATSEAGKSSGHSLSFDIEVQFQQNWHFRDETNLATFHTETQHPANLMASVRVRSAVFSFHIL